MTIEPTQRSGRPAEGLSRRLAVHAASARVGAMPPAVLAATRASMLDQLGVILAASALGEGVAPFIRMAIDDGGSAATVLGCSARSSVGMAAFANGAMAHALDYEDTHDATLVHPMAAVLPAALAVAEARGASGADLLAALAVGADISCRLALAFDGNPERPDGFLLLPLLGAFGATAAVGRLLGSAPERIEQAFSLAFSQVAASKAVQRHDASHFRAVRDAFTARAAVTAAQLAHDGINGFDAPFEGPAGYYALYAGGRFDADRALDALGERYEGASVSFKPWPSCRGTHAFVEAALALRTQHRIAADRVVGIHATVSPFFAVLCEPLALRVRPANAVSAKFSIPYTVAVALARGRVGFEDFDAPSLGDPQLLRLAGLCTHEVNPGWGQAESTAGVLAIVLDDGRRVEHRVQDPLGHPSNPLPADALLDKFVDCATRARRPLTREQALLLAARIRALESLDSVCGLMAVG